MEMVLGKVEMHLDVAAVVYLVLLIFCGRFEPFNKRIREG